MMEGNGRGPPTHHSPDAELFEGLCLFGPDITTPGILPLSGIHSMARLRGKIDLENNEIQQSEPVKAAASEQMGQRSSCVKAPAISVTNSAICQGVENIPPNPIVRGSNHSEPQLTKIGSSSSILSSETAQAKKKKTTTLVAKLREQNGQQFNFKSSTISKGPEGVEHALEVFNKILQNIPKSGRQSVRALKKMQACYSYLFSYPEGKVGSLPEVEVGRKVKLRVELKILGLHRQVEKGIDCKEVSGNRKDGHKELLALSVVSSNAYEDDLDKGETLIFTGEGGRNKKTKRQTEDQVLGGGNEALYNSYFRQNSIRVIRHRYDAQGMKRWYIYDGLYKVKDKKKVTGISGKEVWQFKLVREPNQKPLEWFPLVATTRKGQGKQASLRREVQEMRGEGVRGKEEGSRGHVEGKRPKRNEEESEEETSMSESDEDGNLSDSEDEEEEVKSTDFEGEAEDHLFSSKKGMEEGFVFGKIKRPRDHSEGKKLLRVGEDAKLMGSEEKYRAVVDKFKPHDMRGKVVIEGGLCQFSNLAKKSRSSVCGKQHRNGDAHQEERSNGMGEVLLVPKHRENTFCTKQSEGMHHVSKLQEANLPMQVVTEDEDMDVENGNDIEESDDEEFEVEAIMNHRTRTIDGCEQLEYFVSWKNYDEDEDSWQPAENLENAPIIVENYWKDIGY